MEDRAQRRAHAPQWVRPNEKTFAKHTKNKKFLKVCVQRKDMKKGLKNN